MAIVVFLFLEGLTFTGSFAIDRVFPWLAKLIALLSANTSLSATTLSIVEISAAEIVIESDLCNCYGLVTSELFLHVDNVLVLPVSSA